MRRGGWSCWGGTERWRAIHLIHPIHPTYLIHPIDQVEGEARLPPSNNCWMTVATSWGDDLVVVGGRSGGLHCFSSSGLDNLVASWPGLHGKQGVSALVAEDRSSLWSAGRDGKIRRLGRREGGVQVFVSRVFFQSR